MSPRRSTRALAAALLSIGLSATMVPTAPSAHAAPGNPLGGPWGHYTGPIDRTWPAYVNATGRQKQLFAKVALQPRVSWFTETTSVDRLPEALGGYIHNMQKGNPDALVQFALFRQWPRGELNRHIPLTAEEQAAYRHWIDTAVATIGNARALIVLEPDLALDAPGRRGLKTADPAVRLSLVRYAAQRLAQLPRATVYLEAGAPDWLKPWRATRLLIDAGIAYTEGFALGGTHHTSVGADVDYAWKIRNQLAARGYPNKRVVLDTADNGRPFTFQQYRRKYPRAPFITPVMCKTKREKRCNTLGVPPTTRVTAYRRKLGTNARQQARLGAIVDAFVWMGRPWRGNNGAHFSPTRLLKAARTTPFQ